MQFCYTPEERELLAFASQSIRGNLPLARLRSTESTVNAWGALAKDGWLHASIDGGSDTLPLATLAGLAHEAGAVAAGPEFAQNAWLIPHLCAAVDDPTEASSWLAWHLNWPGYVNPLPVALPGVPASTVALGAHPDFDHYTVLDEGGGLHLRRTHASDATIDYVAGLSLSAGRIGLAAGERAEASLALDGEARAAVGAGLLILRCAALVGTARELLRRTITYVTERHQFGRPLGQFQAVKHLCADVHTELEVTWLAVLYAAVQWKEDPAALPSARAQSSSAAFAAARVSAQLHGGMGFTWESDLHWLLKSTLDGELAIVDAASAALSIGELLMESA